MRSCGESGGLGGEVCLGDIIAELQPGSTDILWQCPLCGENGVIRGWEDTLWNRRPGFDAEDTDR